GEAVAVQGKFADGRLFRALYLPRQSAHCERIVCYGVGSKFEGEWRGGDRDDTGWAGLVQQFEVAVERLRAAPRAAPGSGPPIGPVLFGFLGLQLLRWLVPPAVSDASQKRPDASAKRR